MHERRAIREAVIAALLGPNAPASYATAAGDRVTKSRIAPNPEASLPTISVYGSDESIDPASLRTAPRELSRKVQITIDAWVAVAPGVSLDDTLDDGLCLQIETALDQDRWLDDDEVIDDIMLVSTEIGQDLTGARPMGVARMVFEVTYYTQRRIAGAMGALPEFDKMGVTYPKLDGQTTINPGNQVSDLKTGIHE